MNGEFSYLYWLIIGCEAAFWVVLALALSARYLLRNQQVSRVLLLTLPVVDLLLLIFTALDLRSGTPATLAHGLATAYVGFTVVFGPPVVRWADRYFAHWFADGPAPAAAQARAWAAVKEELALWFRSIVAWSVTLGLLIALIAFIDDDAVTRELLTWFRIAFGSVIIWFVLGPVWSLVFFRRETAKGG